MLILENNKSIIYLISGKARSGKNTVTDIIKSCYTALGKRVVITSIAKYIKMMCMELSDWDGMDTTKPRELLQVLGTDIIRDRLKHDTLFIDRTIDDIEIYSHLVDVIIISDIRFTKELEMIKDKYPEAVSIRVIRNTNNDLTVSAQHHISETDLDQYDHFNYKIINDRTIDDLKSLVIGLIEKRYKDES